MPDDIPPSAAAQQVIDRLRGQLDHAINAEVIDNTFFVYRQLFGSLAELASYLDVTPESVPSSTVRHWMRRPQPQPLSRSQLDEVLQLLPEDLHTSLGGTPEFNHPSGRYAQFPESRSGLLFSYVIDAIREKALERRRQSPSGG
jgi:hypothetical protein